jgi:tight adherence protein B
VTRRTSLVGQGTVLAFTLTWLLVILFFFATDERVGNIAIRRHRENLDKRLRFLRLRYPASRIVAGQLLGCIVGVGLSLLRNSVLPLLFLPPIILGPKVQIERLVARRVTAIEEQIEPWLNAVANALKASPSLGEAIASSSALLPAPMSQEIDLLVKEYELGTSLDRALEQFAHRIGSKTLTGAVLALQVARNSGGNLPETLENAAAALRELARLEGVVRTKTAEGKAQAFVIGMIPIPMVVGIHLMDARFFEPLVATFTGHLVIGAAVVVWALAIVLASKILAVDV